MNDERIVSRRWRTRFVRLLVLMTLVSGALFLWFTAMPSTQADDIPPSLPAPTNVAKQPTDLDQAVREYIRLYKPKWINNVMTNYLTFDYPPTDDTFVAKNRPYNYYSFGQAEALFVGNVEELGETRIFLKFPNPPAEIVSSGAYFLGSLLAFGVAGEKIAASMAVTVAAVPFYDKYMSWESRPPVRPITQTQLGPAGHWYLTEVTLYDKYDGLPYPHNLFGLYAPHAQNWKASWSLEKNPDYAPHLIYVYLPDTVPPTCTIKTLPPVIYHSAIKLEGRAWDPLGYLQEYGVWYRLDDGPWNRVLGLPLDTPRTDFSWSTWFNVPKKGGHDLWFKCTVKDRAGHQSETKPIRVHINEKPPLLKRLYLPSYIRNKLVYMIDLDYPVPAPHYPVPAPLWANIYGKVSPDSPPYLISIAFGRQRRLRSKLFNLSSLVGRFLYLEVHTSDDLGNTAVITLPRPYRVYRWSIRGRSLDNRGFPLPTPKMSVTPKPVGTILETSQYTLYLAQPITHHLALHFTPDFSTTLEVAYDANRFPDMHMDIHTGIGEEQVHNASFEKGLTGWITHTKRIKVTLDASYLGSKGVSLSPAMIGQFPVFGAVGLNDGREMYLVRRSAPQGLIHRRDGSWAFTPKVDIPGYVGAWYGVRDSRGRVHTLLFAHQEGSCTVYYVQWTPQGHWTTPRRLASYPTEWYFNGGIEVDPQDNIHVTWTFPSRDDVKTIYYTRLSPNGEWTDIRTFSTSVPTWGAKIVSTLTRVWLIVPRRDNSVCVFRSVNHGDTWDGPRCETLLEGIAPQLFIYRAGWNGPYLYTREKLFKWMGSWWKELDASNIKYRAPVGCPDGTLHFIGRVDPGDQRVVGDIVLDGRGQPLRTEQWGQVTYDIYEATAWCDDQTRGILVSNALLTMLSMRVDPQPHLLPILSQRVHVPTIAPTLGFYVRGVNTDFGEMMGILTPEQGEPLTITVPLQKGWTYANLPADTLAGQEVTVTLALSLTLAGQPLPVAIDDVSLRSTPLDVAISGAIQSPMTATSPITVRMTVQNRRPITIPEASVDITWTQGYTLSTSSLPVDISAPLRANAVIHNLAASGQQSFLLTFQRQEETAGDFALRVRSLLSDADILRSNDVWEGHRFSHVRQRFHLPVMVQGASRAD